MEQDKTEERFWLVSGGTDDGAKFDGSMTFCKGTAVDAEPDQIVLTVFDRAGVYEMLIERRGESFVRIITRADIKEIEVAGDLIYKALPSAIASADWLRRGPFFADRDLHRDAK